jgi:hypothetical protein
MPHWASLIFLGLAVWLGLDIIIVWYLNRYKG